MDKNPQPIRAYKDAKVIFLSGGGSIPRPDPFRDLTTSKSEFPKPERFNYIPEPNPEPKLISYNPKPKPHDLLREDPRDPFRPRFSDDDYRKRRILEMYLSSPDAHRRDTLDDDHPLSSRNKDLLRLQKFIYEKKFPEIPRMTVRKKDSLPELSREKSPFRSKRGLAFNAYEELKSAARTAQVFDSPTFLDDVRENYLRRLELARILGEVSPMDYTIARSAARSPEGPFGR